MPPAERRIFQGPLRRKLSCPPTPLASPAFHLREPQVSDSCATGVNGMAYGILRFGREMLARGTFCHAERRLALGKDSRNNLGTLDFPSPFTSFFSPQDLADHWKTKGHFSGKLNTHENAPPKNFMEMQMSFYSQIPLPMGGLYPKQVESMAMCLTSAPHAVSLHCLSFLESGGI